MKSYLVSLLFFILAGGNWLTNFDAARETAAQEHKFILLNFSGSDWCGPCIKMKQEVFENDAFLQLAEKKLVLVRADFPRTKKNQLPKEQKEQNEALAQKYNPSGKFPLTLLLDESGKVIKEWDGYVFSSQDKVIAELTESLSN
jgi:thioredoxin-related protein